MGRSSIKDIDRGWKNIGRNLSAYSKKTIYVGLPREKPGPTTDEGYSMAEIGALHEFGSLDGHVPERKWLRSAVDHFRSAITERYVKLWERIMRGNYVDVDEGFNRIGMFGVSRIREYIRKVGPGIWRPLSAFTIARKLSDRPLINTGQLMQSITYIVTGKKDNRV